MPKEQDYHSATEGQRTIYRGKAPEQKPMLLLAAGLVGLCLAGLILRGAEPFILAALVLAPVAVLTYHLFDRWGRRRIRRVDMEGTDLVLRIDFEKARRVPLNGIGEWTVEEIALYSAGSSYDAGQAVQVDTGADVTGPALVAVETATGRRIELVVDEAEIDIGAFRAFAPAAVEELESRKGKRA